MATTIQAGTGESTKKLINYRAEGGVAVPDPLALVPE